MFLRVSDARCLTLLIRILIHLALLFMSFSVFRFLSSIFYIFQMFMDDGRGWQLAPWSLSSHRDLHCAVTIRSDIVKHMVKHVVTLTKACGQKFGHTYSTRHQRWPCGYNNCS